MIAVDTNVLARIVTNDDRRQASDAVNLLRRQESVFIAKTVILELEWVLRSAYKVDPQAILTAIRRFCDLPNAEVENETAVRQALEWFAQGLDFADALHLASSGSERRFVTFDAALVRKARQFGLKAARVS